MISLSLNATDLELVARLMLRLAPNVTPPKFTLPELDQLDTLLAGLEEIR